MIPILKCRWYRHRLARAEAAHADPTPRLRRHLATCDSCRAALREQELLVAALGAVELEAPVPARVWDRLAARMAEPIPDVSLKQPGAWRGRAVLGWALHDAPVWAVAIIAALSLLLLWQASGGEPPGARGDRGVAADAQESATPAKGSGERARERAETAGDGASRLAMVPVNLDVGTYVRQVSVTAPPTEFWGAYRAREAPAAELASGLDFRPIVPDQLPHGFLRVDSKLLRDACCETLQVRYEAPDRWLDLFQCHDDHPIEFGEAKVDRREVAGVVCTAFEWDDGRVRGRSFQLGELSLVALGNVTDDVLDDVVADLASR